MCDLLAELDKKPERMAPGDARARSGYGGQFKEMWRRRFAHLHPDLIPLAVEAEWQRMEWVEVDGEGMWVSKTPIHWKGSPAYDGDSGWQLMRDNR